MFRKQSQFTHKIFCPISKLRK